MDTPRVTSFKKYTGHYRRRYLLPLCFLLVSFLLMILPLQGLINSVKVVLAYAFIPQVRAAHGIVEYGQDVSDTVYELLRTHQENEKLKQTIENTQLLSAQAQEVFAENKRLSELLNIQASFPWKGVWAKVAYREPTQWNSVMVDKGAADGIQPRSAVIALENGQEGLAGVVIEVTENTSKVLLVRDEDFAAAVRLSRGGEEGLLIGQGPRPAYIKYVPLLAQVEKGDKVYTSATSSVFPAGILVGTVSNVMGKDSFQTALSVEIVPQVHSSSVREVFIILDKPKAK